MIACGQRANRFYFIMYKLGGPRYKRTRDAITSSWFSSRRNFFPLQSMNSIYYSLGVYELTWLFGVYLSSNFHQDTTCRIYIPPLFVIFLFSAVDTSNTRLLSLCGATSYTVYMVYGTLLCALCACSISTLVVRTLCTVAKTVWLTGWRLKHMSILSLLCSLSRTICSQLNAENNILSEQYIMCPCARKQCHHRNAIMLWIESIHLLAV